MPVKEQPAPKYKWESPADWLREMAQGWTQERLYSELMNLATSMDQDSLQDGFQSEMEADGYFVDIGKRERIAALIKDMPRIRCIILLDKIDAGFNYPDDESIDSLRENIQTAFDEGHLKEEDLSA